ncbi:PREDICTED: uncharacterized protein F21D5.5 [Ceratosolen solmsi marchali]|uniref:Uncharacterized protein F21D5.5 n=1 Tax=Ceratosolen solmsi marchali TaxID=326594 RepID=A0AAJ6YX75_9HYME|nr:PREDICTED: uncharacterized protein F21D5.5 [Ceratosolen solmsi marchali]
MSSKIQSCYLCSKDIPFLSVYLPDKQAIFVGRSADTKITDTQCSRKQVRLYANYDDHKVFIEQVGVRPCGFNGFKTKRGVKFIGQDGDCLELLYGKHAYKIGFTPPPMKNLGNLETHKRLLFDDTEDNEPLAMKKLKLKDNNGDKPDMKDYSNGKWEHFTNNTLFVYTSEGCEGRSKIAAYDMDKTLIKTKSGLEFPRDTNDWELLNLLVPGNLKKYYDDDYKIVVFSNQASLGTAKTPLKDFKLKIEGLVKRIGIPMQVYLAAGQSIYRKPRTGMWDFLLSQMNDNVTVDKEKSFFVGDAAGRPGVPGRKKDHSLADRLFAINLNLTFFTPEEHYFGHKKVSYNAPSFHPKEAIKNTVLYEPQQSKLTLDKQELIVMVGSPGSGKSHFAKIHLKSYHYVNRDTLGNWQKCIMKTNEALAQGKSVVVDNTNPDKNSRQRYLDIAKKHNVSSRCFVMNINKEHIKHNNIFRVLTDSTHQVISDMIINSYLKNFIPPTEDEGFSEIVKINFVPSFKSEEDKKLYEMYLLG